MSFQASFKQILRDKMGENSNFSPENQVSSLNSDPAHLAFLLGQINRLEFQTRRGHYPQQKVRPQRKAHSFTPTQKLAYEFLKTWAHDLHEGFTATELKKAFRQAALALHPDHGGNTQQFLELKAHFQTLRALTPL
ncbi:MAG: hypothetical protein OM95_13230 [Bdellovibrio sp. ArHS]|uniref:J domain-containing protein n=1 Tax=Bdellovibrio sp. ArHS TaxID=1569284 RepID=UPI000582A309|nr:J domain-containing protein [Bdellovibrio sp. ArHS]KHD87660.1 MAG: hypothetical protein OM95_13230 [Bdellovibrio sp. ArHS]